MKSSAEFLLGIFSCGEKNFAASTWTPEPGNLFIFCSSWNGLSSASLDDQWVEKTLFTQPVTSSHIFASETKKTQTSGQWNVVVWTAFRSKWNRSVQLLDLKQRWWNGSTEMAQPSCEIRCWGPSGSQPPALNGANIDFLNKLEMLGLPQMLMTTDELWGGNYCMCVVFFCPSQFMWNNFKLSKSIIQNPTALFKPKTDRQVFHHHRYFCLIGISRKVKHNHIRMMKMSPWIFPPHIIISISAMKWCSESIFIRTQQ